MTGAGTVTPVPEPSKSSRIKVGRKATTVPELDTLDSLQRGEVYIHQSGEKPYEDNQKLVLELEGPSPRRRLEVKSVTKTLTEAHLTQWAKRRTNGKGEALRLSQSPQKSSVCQRVDLVYFNRRGTDRGNDDTVRCPVARAESWSGPGKRPDRFVVDC